MSVRLDGRRVVQPLEPRRLLAATPAGDEFVRTQALPPNEQGELFVEGTNAADHIIVERTMTRVFLNINGSVQGFDAGDVLFLSISGHGGDDDIINASFIPSTIHGGDGNDTIWGGVGRDSLRGFGGNDSLRGGHGDDVLAGDDGDDTLHGGDGSDILTGGPGANMQLFGEISAEIRGSELFVDGSDLGDGISVERIGDELVVGATSSRSGFFGFRPYQRFNAAGVRFISINGYGGDDDIVNATDLPSTIHGGDGSDTMYGGTATDSMRGQGGEDELRGGDGDDLLLGDTGNDTLHGGGGGADTLTGAAGDDVLMYGEVLDRVVPGVTFAPPADRFINGETQQLFSGAVTVVGTEGDDLITLDTSGHSTIVTVNGLSTAVLGFHATLVGLGGNDTLVGGSESFDVLNGGPGTDELFGSGFYSDVVDYSSHTNGVSVSLDGIRNDGEPGENDLLVDFYGVIGGSGNDRITGNDENNALRGGPGNDTLDGGGEQDALLGEDGNDELRTGAGNDHAEGGAGNDVLHADDADPLEVIRSGRSDRLFGGDGNDRLLAVDGMFDFVRGGPGNDTADTDPVDRNVREVESHRIVSPKDGFVVVGTELFVYGSDYGGEIGVWGGGEYLILELGGNSTYIEAAKVRSISINGYGGPDTIYNDTDLPSTIHGGDHNDTIRGGSGADSIRGQGGNDSLYGRDGNDLLFGDTGDDRLDGGAGTDTLAGGPGADELLFGEILDGVLPE